MLPTARRSWLHWSASWPRVLKLWSVTLAFGAISRWSANQHFAIDPDKIAEEKKFDGIFTDLNPLEAMLCYKQLWTLEQTFRTAKHLLARWPIFHKLDETIRPSAAMCSAASSRWC